MRQPVQVHVGFGPVACASALAWIDDARLVLERVRAAGDALPVVLPPEIEAAFIAYLDEWEAHANAHDRFEWSAEVGVEQVRHLAIYFFSLVSIDDETWAAYGLPFTSEVAKPFIHALTTAVTEALAEVDKEVGASIKASFPGAAVEIPRRWQGEPGRRFRVVIVDDTEDVRLLLAMTLKVDGRFDVVGAATNGRAGIELCREVQPDGVLLDVMMPVLDGLEALPELRDSCPGARIVMLSANDNPDIVKLARSRGADAFVTKGAALELALEALLDG